MIDYSAAEWPTGKPHVSFSELSNWLECAFRHKLIYIDKLGSASVTPHLSFGSAVHGGIENFLKKGLVEPSVVADEIRREWEKNKDLFENGPFPSWAPKGFGSVDEWIKRSNRILSDIPGWLDKKFPGYGVENSEELLYESIVDQPINFKGYVDAVLRVPTKQGLVYWIIDWKTCSWGWSAFKKRDFKVQLQLILYKSFWAKKHKKDLKDVRCGFGLLMREPSPNVEFAIDIVPVSVGPLTEQKGLKVINNHVKSIQRGFFFKNRDSCRFCEFENTSHCP